MSAARRSRPAAQANRQLTFSRRQTLSRFGSRLPERFDLGFNKDADKIASTCVPADRQIEDFSVIRKRATPNNIERFGLLGQYDSTISKRECIGGVANRLAMTARFKFRILRSLLEEVRESRIEITQRLLKNNRTDLGKEGFLRFLFPFGEFQCGIGLCCKNRTRALLMV